MIDAAEQCSDSKGSFKMTRRWLALALILLVTSTTWRFIESSNVPVQTEENTCTLYLAPSSMEGVSGVGIFTAKSFKEGSIISPPDSPSIPVCPPWPHSGLINDYWWGEGKGTSDDMSFECSEYTVDMFVMFGALPNYHTLLMNFIIEIDPVPYDDTFVETTAGNPGAGAFSYHGGRTIVANTDIEAGDELFLDYGLEYREDDGFHGHWFEHAPRSADFEIGAGIMENSWEHLEALEAICDKIKDPAVAEEVIEHTLAVMRETATEINERVASILPKTALQLDRIAERLHDEWELQDLSQALAKEVSLNRKSPEWLVENGRCVDNIVPGRSKLPFAGRGAIAQRFIAGGEVVVPVPLIQIMDTDDLTIWEEVQNENGDWDEVPVGKQLLLNYCFGHDESSLLLCPITNAILINHCSNRAKECGEDGPNAEYRWDTEFDRDTKQWLEMSLDDMAEREGRGLSFEVVATRDIQPGEEIFMDYSIKWEEAWDRHVDDWNPGEEKPLESVKQLNDDGGPIKILSGDLRALADHESITTGCVYWDEFQDDEQGYQDYYEDEGWDDEYYELFPETDVLWRYGEDGERVYRPLLFEDDSLEMSPSDDLWHELSDEEILWYFSEDGTQFTPENSPRRHSFGGIYWPCSIVREDKDGSYVVQVFARPKSRTHQLPLWFEEGLPRFLTNYPRDSIRYFTRPDRSDMHLASAFRHHIDIPDDMFPPQWKDRRLDEVYNDEL